MAESYWFLEHTAEVKFKAIGETLAKVFENSVLALSDYLSNGQKISAKKGKMVRISGRDKEHLFYNLLEEVISLLDSDDFLVKKAVVKVFGNNLDVEFYGEDSSKLKGLNYVKAPTYSEMFVRESKDGWEAQVVLDV